jgi:multidrug efflux system membrane fusion protein
MSQANIKVGNIAHATDPVPIATINQMRPIYVTFQVAQQDLPAIRAAMAAGTASVEAAAPEEPRASHGEISMVENAIDPTTGLAVVRATMPNEDELLWPGSIVNARLTLDSEDAVVVPTSAVQVSQAGTFVYVVENAVALVKRVVVARANGDETALRSGLAGGETVVTDGHLLLSDGTPVRVVNAKPQPGQAGQ